MNVKEFALGSALGLLIGFGIGMFVSDETPEAEPEFVAHAASAPVECPPTRAPVTVESSRCETMLALAKGELDDGNTERDEELIAYLEELLEKSGGASAKGTAMKFPDGLEPAYTPDGLPLPSIP